jgi:hypothetical protein
VRGLWGYSVSGERRLAVGVNELTPKYPSAKGLSRLENGQHPLRVGQMHWTRCCSEIQVDPIPIPYNLHNIVQYYARLT